GQGLGGHVLPAGIVENLNLLSLAHPGRQLLERNVAALLGVVELAAFIAFDDAYHRRHPSLAAALRRAGVFSCAAKASAQHRYTALRHKRQEGFRTAATTGSGPPDNSSQQFRPRSASPRRSAGGAASS